jgi:hypothetical protein
LNARPDWLKAPDSRDVTLMSTTGEQITAAYSKPEQRLMSELRAAGADDHELRTLHEIKHYLGVDLVADTVEYADSATPRARAVGSGSQWDDSRNTSNRSGATYGLTEAQKQRQQRDTELQARKEREAAEAARQGTIFTEQGENASRD